MFESPESGATMSQAGPTGPSATVVVYHQTDRHCKRAARWVDDEHGNFPEEPSSGPRAAMAATTTIHHPTHPPSRGPSADRQPLRGVVISR
jgi:hypothetical protein